MISPRMLFVSFTALIVTAFIGSSLWERDQIKNNSEVLVAKVIKTERLCETTSDTDSEGHTTYDTTCVNYVHTDRETFTNENSIWLPAKDSLRAQGILVNGESYRFTVYGVSNPRFGQYRNISSEHPPEHIIPGGGSTGGAGSEGQWAS